MTELTRTEPARIAATARRRPVASRARGWALAVGGITLVLALAGCVPEPEPGASNSPVPTASAEPSTVPSSTEGEPSAEPSTATDRLEALPADCEALYSPAMRQSLDEANPPLNHPGVTMDSTEVVAGLELLSSGVPTLRCTWGGPSGYGLATNVTIVTPEELESMAAALRNSGFTCSEAGAEIRCEQTRTFADPPATTGEVQVLRANAWVSTRWINFNPAGYTEDIIAQLFS